MEINSAITRALPNVALRLRAGPAVTAALLVLVLVTLSSSLLGGKIYTSGDNIFLWPPFSAERPAGWVRPSNFILTDPVLGLNPDILQTRADIRSGTLPLWNPYAGAGRPLLASQVHAPLFPLTWLAYMLPFWSSLAWIAAAKVLLAASGLYLLCRDLALRRGPSLFGAIAFAFGSYFFVWLEHPQTNVWAMLPWMFFATRRVCSRGSLGAAAVLGLSSGLAWLGGHPESGAFLFGATAVYGAFELLSERLSGSDPDYVEAAWLGPDWTHTIKGRALLLVGGLGLGLGVSAIVNVPLIELLGQSGKTQRGGAGDPFSAGWSFFFPELWGSPNKAFSGSGPLNYNERTAYIGALPMLLALASVGRRRPREQWFFVVIAVILLATIFNTPLWANGVRSLPAGKVAALGRLLIIVSFAGAVLAAYGLQRWIVGSAQVRRQMLGIMGVVALILPLAWLSRHLGVLSHLPAALTQLPAIHYGEQNASVVALASVWRWILLCALGLGVLIIARRRSAALVVALAIVVTGADLVALDRGYHGSIPVTQANPSVPASIRYLQSHQGDARITGSRLSLPANLAERYGLRDPRVAIDIPYPTRYSQLWTKLGGTGGDQEFFTANTPDAQRLADLFATRYILLAPGEPVPFWLRPVLRTPGGVVAFNSTALPRAWVAYDWRQAVSEGDDFELTVDSRIPLLRDTPIVEGAPAPPSGPAPSVTTARVVGDGPEAVTIEAVARRPGYLILDDSAYPGWKATLDGRAVAWQPANENFRAVAIPAGRHVIRFSYRPASVLIGAILTVLCALGLLALATLGFVWVRRAPSSNAGASNSGQRTRPASWARNLASRTRVRSP